MKILPVAFDSMGVRSMATYIETSDARIFIDPGVSISPDRYSLPPHRIELDRRREMLEAVKQWVKASDIIIITHYHYDHHNPDEVCLYENKDIFLKHPREQINESQRQRAAALLGMIESCAKAITIIDGNTFSLGNTRLVFSKPVFHGQSPQLGFVIEVYIEEKEKFLYTSDVQGPLDDEALDFILQMAPETIILDGPATYLVGTHYKKTDIARALENTRKIIRAPSVKELIIDHHLMRDLNWSGYIAELGNVRNKVKVCSAAEFLGRQEDILEARREELYKGSTSA